MDNHEEPEDISLLVQACLGPARGRTGDEHGNGLQDQEAGGGGAPDDVAPNTVDLCVYIWKVVQCWECWKQRGLERERGELTETKSRRGCYGEYLTGA
jgi:hypothetical protein